jgi:hypothetical protein
MIAELLSVRIHVVLDMPIEEFLGWVAYFNVKASKAKLKSNG